MKRAVLYARVSSDDTHRDDRNLRGQLDMCRERAHSRGWQVVAELPEDDRGASGASFELPQLNRVREMARAKDFDVLVVREIDRLSRSLAKQLIVEEEMKRAGVQIDYVLGEYPDTPEGNLMKNIKASVAEYERLKIMERMVRGRRQKVKAGSVLMHGHDPFGYRRVEIGGKWVLEINEVEAQVVRMIFNWYTIGDGVHAPLAMYKIALQLNELGIPSRADKNPSLQKERGWGRWSSSSIQKMLTNETYRGVWRYQKSNKHQDVERLAVDVPAIISDDTWKMAVQRRKENFSEARRNRKYDYLLRGRVICGGCGCRMRAQGRLGRGKHYTYYACDSKYRNSIRSCETSVGFRSDQVDPAVWGWVKSFLMNPVALAEGLTAQQEEQERQNAPIRERLKVVDDLLAENQQKLDRLLDLYLAGDFAKDVLAERKVRLEATVAALTKERDNIVRALDGSGLTVEQIRDLQAFAAQVAADLAANEDDFDTMRRVVEALNLEITLAVEDGEKVCYVRGALTSNPERLFIVTTNPHSH
jgi:site-specific DNA recombinase